MIRLVHLCLPHYCGLGLSSTDCHLLIVLIPTPHLRLHSPNTSFPCCSHLDPHSHIARSPGSQHLIPGLHSHLDPNTSFPCYTVTWILTPHSQVARISSTPTFTWILIPILHGHLDPNTSFPGCTVTWILTPHSHVTQSP